MALTVVDASALAAVAFGEPEAESVNERLKGATLLASGLIWFELANICLKKIRRQPEDAERFLAGFSYARHLGIQEREVDYLAVIALARRTGLSAYDASYLWLSRELGVELVSNDTQLNQAAESAP
ncbi:MAG: type II toxin-antitoxin system VapC family toxin [Planctomycetes bacterium]|nr:type II toxin-antitoxin system VapC family toxin [Planctomycetota bacterium]